MGADGLAPGGPLLRGIGHLGPHALGLVGRPVVLRLVGLHAAVERPAIAPDIAGGIGDAGGPGGEELGMLGGGRVVHRALLRADHEEDRLHLVLTAEHLPGVRLDQGNGLQALGAVPALQGVDLTLPGDPLRLGLLAKPIRAVVKRLDIGRLLG